MARSKGPLGLLLALALGLLVALCVTSASADIVSENLKPGSPPSEWDIQGSGSPTIQGFATEFSVNVGQTVSFKIDSQSNSFRLDIYRMGFYGGNGARKVAGIVPSDAARQTSTNQPNCVFQADIGLVDCGNWQTTSFWKVPADAVSGVYFALVQRTDCAQEGAASHIFFVVRNDQDTASEVIIQTSDTTWQAYNTYGGQSFYVSNTGVGVVQGHAYAVSYNRPFLTRDGGTITDFVFYAEYPLIRFMESQGYAVTYISGIDTDRDPTVLNGRKVFISVGHDEYYSLPSVNALSSARDAGMNLMFLSGNEVYWKTRFAPSIDGSNTPYRTLISYKDTWDFGLPGYVPDPVEWTGTWRDPRPGQPQPRPENFLTGTLTVSAGGDPNRNMRVSGLFSKLRLWRNTTVAPLAPGATTILGLETIGYEWDSDLDNGFRPAGLIRINSQVETNVGGCINFPGCYGQLGSCVGTCSAETHSLTLYKKGGLVFGAGTVQFVWGLDPEHDGSNVPANREMQQLTVNLLADMNVQPVTLAANLVASGPSSDTTGPTAQITSPVDGADVPIGSLVISGTATDVGGVVGGVEVSYDNGVSYNRADLLGPADTTVQWQYAVPANVVGTVIILTRATDDSANIGALAGPVTATVAPAPPCFTGCTLFGLTAPDPNNQIENDPQAVELGTRMLFSDPVTLTGIRFFSGGEVNAGPHVGRIWRVSDQALLASVTFTGVTATGWQTQALDAPIIASTSESYIISIHAPAGNYAATNAGFNTAVTSGAVTAPAGTPAAPNGVYRYGAGGVFPTDTFQNSNYWVDVVYDV